jgi:type IX secretion system PorP/SprF family membrane protein
VNFGTGIYFTNPKFYVGLSVPRILKNSLYFDKDNFGAKVNTYYLQAGFKKDLSSSVTLMPNAQIRLNPNSPFDFDLNMNVKFFDAFMIGANYRFEDSIDGLVRFFFKNGLHVGLAMDFTASDLKKSTTGSYEIMLGYTFPCEDCTIKNIRYFSN